MPRKQNLEMRSRILRESIEIFLEHGYRQTTMGTIAEACGITRPLLQHYYAKKENILAQYFYNVLEEAISFVATRLIPQPSVYGSHATPLFICSQTKLFYHILTRDNNALLKLYSEILFNAELLMRGITFASKSIRYPGMTVTAKDYRGWYVLNGVLSQFVALYLDKNPYERFSPILDEAFDLYLTYVGLNHDARSSILETADSLVNTEALEQFDEVFDNISLRFVRVNFE